MRPILQAVALIHHHRLTHLDIKHENIIVTPQPDGTLRPILIDFGQAKHYDKKGNATSKLTNAGCSEGFAPPEQYLGLTKFTPQADVYALCATLLYLLTAKQPISSGEITAKDIKDMLPDGIPPYIENAIVNGMRRNKDDRTQSVELLADALKLDISQIGYNISDDLNITKKIIPKPNLKLKFKLILAKLNIDYSKTLKIIGLIFALAVIVGGIIWLKNRPIPSQSLTQSQLLTDAIANKDTDMLTQFADNDSARAFLPLAKILYNQGLGDTLVVKEYAQKALMFKPDSLDAQKLIDLIAQSNQGYEYFDLSERAETESTYNTGRSDADSKIEIKQNERKSNDELFDEATSISDFKALADQGYSKAYAPLANLYLNNRNYKSADTYARKALASGMNTDVANYVVKILDALGYYDDPTNGDKPL
jgi:serine/threonine protein kinase